MTASKDDPAEIALASLLDVLAASLVELGITPLRLAQVSRVSFVKAAATIARKRSSGRPHLAKIAALTGLSRAEVKRIVSAGYRVSELEPENLPRALRVFVAWHTDPKYVRKGRPRTLRVDGPVPSFTSLCRTHSGDIPHKVILEELLRLGKVRFNKHKISIDAAGAPRITRTKADVAYLTFIASLLADAASPSAILVKRKERIIASPEISDAYLENQVASHVSSMLDNLPRVFTSHRQHLRRKNGVNVFALVTKSRTSPKGK